MESFTVCIVYGAILPKKSPIHSISRTGPSARKGAYGRDVYDSQRWKNCRTDKLRQNPLCEECLAKGLTESATHVHHKTKVAESAKGQSNATRQLAFSASNLISLCVRCHEVYEQTGRIVVVNGMPGSGKTTYAKKMAGSRDIIVDLDLLLDAVTNGIGKTERTHTLIYALICKDALESYIEHIRHSHTVFIVSGAHSDKARELSTRLGAEYICMDASQELCRERVRVRGRDVEALLNVIKEWR